MMKFTKVESGWYASEDGRYAAVSDGYRPGLHSVDGEAVGGEWAAAFDPRGGLRDGHQEGENLDWFPTKREAVAYCQQRQEGRERFNAALAKSSPALWREDV